MGDSLAVQPSVSIPLEELPEKFVPAPSPPPEPVDLRAVLRRSLAEGAQSPVAIMQAATDAARVLAGADGVALALRTKGIIVCRARSGDPAPEVGSPLNIGSGISGQCLRSGSILICHDAAGDPRVDSEVCRAMGIRSIAVLPLRGTTGMAGILEAFSTRAHAFGEEQMDLLRDLAEIAETAYAMEYSALQEAAFASLRAVHNLTQSNPGSAGKDASVKDHQQEEQPASAQPPALQTASAVRRYWVIGAAIAAPLLIAGIWLSGRDPAPEAAASPLPRASSTSIQTPANDPGLVSLPKPKAGTIRGETRQDSAAGAVKKAAEISIEEADDSEPVVISAAPAPSPTKIARASVPTPAIDPPSVQMASQVSHDQLASLTAVPNTLPTLLPRVSEGVSGGQLVRKVDPLYPTQARNQRMAGNVSLEITVAPDGSVREVKQVNGSPVLGAAAMDAVRKWRYAPSLLNGQPVEVRKNVVVVFRLP